MIYIPCKPRNCHHVFIGCQAHLGFLWLLFASKKSQFRRSLVCIVGWIHVSSIAMKDCKNSFVLFDHQSFGNWIMFKSFSCLDGIDSMNELLGTGNNQTLWTSMFSRRLIIIRLRYSYNYGEWSCINDRKELSAQVGRTWEQKKILKAVTSQTTDKISWRGGGKKRIWNRDSLP